jgi:hypothetical protein
VCFVKKQLNSTRGLVNEIKKKKCLEGSEAAVAGGK